MYKHLKRHIHKYYKADVLGEKLWACALPTCNHHMPPHYSSLISGKATICWECNDIMVLHAYALEMDKPICLVCRRRNSMDDRLKRIDLRG